MKRMTSNRKSFLKKIEIFLLLMFISCGVCSCAIDQEKDEDFFLYLSTLRKEVKLICEKFGLGQSPNISNTEEQYENIKQYLSDDKMIVYLEIWGENNCEKIARVLGYENLNDLYKSKGFSNSSEYHNSYKNRYLKGREYENAYAGFELECFRDAYRLHINENDQDNMLEQYKKISYRLYEDDLYIYENIVGKEGCDYISQVFGYDNSDDLLIKNGYTDIWGQPSFEAMEQQKQNTLYEKYAKELE